jgi:hypothetical protein
VCKYPHEGTAREAALGGVSERVAKSAALAQLSQRVDVLPDAPTSAADADA